MSGIYLHIPFCKKACHYCDFHFSTSRDLMNDMVQSIVREITLRKNYLAGERVETIYFGGGTPSLLNRDQLQLLLNTINENFEVDADAEITLESNPDDLTIELLQMLKSSGVNRLSIGIQSFREKDLLLMNRAHNAVQALQCVSDAKAAGFENITIDLMYGLPELSSEDWSENMKIAFGLGVDHLSCYSLTVEPRTALASMIKQNKVRDIDDGAAALHFEMLMKAAAENDFEHYEISNFARNGKYSRHNTSYWKREKYLGVGPSAHSYNGDSRQWNVSNNPVYIRSLAENKIPAESEELSLKDKFNEYILTSMRTKWGVNLDFVKEEFGDHLSSELLIRLESQISAGLVLNHGNVFTLSEKGKYFADRVSSDLFI
ncbi:MAG: radical SAM family heme chaperone HemW [Bacteroidetes bacterium]|nr:radical SAM family heme chaperone HemW [Bacteroidota bacterium]